MTAACLSAWIDRASDAPKLVVIYGPTACGKTSLSLDVAEMLGTEIIGADSRQIYADLAIGTGKILPEEMRDIPHHLIGHLPLDRRYSAGEFKTDALTICDRLWAEEKIPVVCGGTGLYIDSLVYDFDLPQTPAVPEYRAEAEAYRQSHGNEALWKHLESLDPEAATTIHPNSYPFVIRALELLEVYGLRKSDLTRSNEPVYDTFFLSPYTGDRTGLYERIDRRVASMFKEGLVDEVRILLNHGCSPDLPGLATIGYVETISHLRGDRDLEETIALVQQKNRNYAKRQITWFRKYAG
ncbi:MAG TPA: tRNA (adenosine(37)-N6)-dimethylallyltransferase MiaA [bacterium]|nr:tRNA (adenosine(37)-N6)-dimethylallyltransferase MiaA [bacterium]